MADIKRPAQPKSFFTGAPAIALVAFVLIAVAAGAIYRAFV